MRTVEFRRYFSPPMQSYPPRSTVPSSTQLDLRARWFLSSLSAFWLLICTVTVICVCQALPGATREKHATRLVLKDGQPDEPSQLFFGQEFLRESSLLNQTLPQFLAKWSNVLAGTGLIQLLAIWTSCCPWRSAYSMSSLLPLSFLVQPRTGQFHRSLWEKKKTSQSFSLTF